MSYTRNLLTNEDHTEGLDEHRIEAVEADVYKDHGDFDAKDDLRAKGMYLHVVRCLQTVSRHKSNMFHTYATHNEDIHVTQPPQNTFSFFSSLRLSKSMAYDIMDVKKSIQTEFAENFK